MINCKTITFDELKKDYSDNQGFVFQSQHPNADKSIENLCQTLIDYHIVESYPEFVVKMDAQTTFFVYPKDSKFDYDEFHKKARIVRWFGQADINTLSVFFRMD